MCAVLDHKYVSCELVIYLFVWNLVHATFLLEDRRDNGISSTGGAPIIQVRIILLLSKSAEIKVSLCIF